MTMTAAAIFGGALITNEGNKSAAKNAANATPQFNTTLQPAIEQTLDAVTGAPTVTPFTGDRVADLNATQQTGLDTTIAQATASGETQGAIRDQFGNIISGGMLGSNPFLDSQIQAGQGSINRNLTRNILPSVRNNAIAAGGIGGSRQGIAEGLAMSDANAQAVDFENRFRGEAYRSDQANLVNTLINQGNVLSNQGREGNLLLGAGGIEQSQAQTEINAEQALFMEQQTLQADRDRELLALLTGTSTSVPQAPNLANPLVAGAGLGITTQQLLANNPTPAAPVATNPNPIFALSSASASP